MRKITNNLPFKNDPLWYKDAIIYELHVRSFKDSDGDGVGDFVGLTEKLDYLEGLGITTLWLLPFYPSPLKDDGYDISDYLNIHSVYGSMADFQTFVFEAHRRGLRIITELVVNHTSDQHPWFQLARRSPPGSRARNFYVWSDTPEKYREARIIFKDYEHSNWTWDHLSGAYYWHRFYSHQPDLNYDNPAVKRELFRTVDFWLKLGVDALRVDAVPYLYERDGTSCENLAETHSFLKELRSHIDKKFQYRMLLAEANQWPEDARAYFGDGDEFHMAFHFPVMPRLFMAIRMEDRFPIMDIVQQTPAIPAGCQWATFLRNHDELTLEMVTDEDRDYMYRMYAADPSARINLGIRRRLAPLLNNNRKKIELMNALLFSLPGTPVIYYGDEIGMGDNFYLGDRNGVRTPMQWSPERNAGFSQVNPQRLFLPTIIDPEYHYEAVNVETQETNTDSLLWWMKHLISLRKRYHAFGRGSLDFLQPQNRKVLAFIRIYNEEKILVVANLSRLPQQTLIDISPYAGLSPVDLFGRVEFSPIGTESYSFTLTPYSFYWFSLEKHQTESFNLGSQPSDGKQELTEIVLAADKLTDKINWNILQPVFQEYIKKQRWFRSKARIIQSCRIMDIAPMNFPRSVAYIVIIQIEFTEGEAETYTLPVIARPVENTSEITLQYPSAAISNIRVQSEDKVLVIYDAMIDRTFCSFLVQSISRTRNFKGLSGTVSTAPTRAFNSIRGLKEGTLTPVPLNVEQTNTSVVYGQQAVLKLFRRIEDGLNPELEIGRFLTEKTSFKNFSPALGAIEYHPAKKSGKSMAILQAYIPNEGDAWQYTLDSLERYFQTVIAHPTVQAPPVPRKHLLSLLKEPPSLAEETISTYLTSAQLLGQRTAELHTALSSVSSDPDFAPERFSRSDQTSVYQSMRSLTIRVFQLLEERRVKLPENIKHDAEQVLGLKDAIIKKYQQVQTQKISAVRIRCHGDYHLGQVLYTGKDFIIIDFEGEPARPLSERRLKRSPIQDVAGMLRSFHYAAHQALNRQSQISARPEDDLPVLQQWSQYWYTWVAVAFLKSYLEHIAQTRVLPEDPDQLKILLDAYLLDKAVYEMNYELNNRPDWLKVPIYGILQLMEFE
ncbi:MAG: maltose alpha-D-glucosyltransferase [Dehalococcoidales bacterium]|nr:maltose alpha-D-glucosyltransferase [Dehalococcoidales bacterium]